jgi:hypothetical protein
MEIKMLSLHGAALVNGSLLFRPYQRVRIAGQPIDEIYSIEQILPTGKIIAHKCDTPYGNHIELDINEIVVSNELKQYVNAKIRVKHPVERWRIRTVGKMYETTVDAVAPSFYNGRDSSCIIFKVPMNTGDSIDGLYTKQHGVRLSLYTAANCPDSLTILQKMTSFEFREWDTD